MLTEAAQLYSDVFTPALFVLRCGLCRIGYEWRGLPTPSLAGLGLLALDWAVGLAIHEGVPLLFETVPTWPSSSTNQIASENMRSSLTTAGMAPIVSHGCRLRVRRPI